MESFITGAFSALIIGGFVALFAKPKSKTALYVQNVILVILSVLCFSMLIFSLTEASEAYVLWAMVIFILLGGFFLGRKLYKNIRLLKSGKLEAPQDVAAPDGTNALPQDVAASDGTNGLPPENAMDFVDGTYYYRVSEIERRKGAVAYFSMFEIVTFTVNLPTAQDVLTEKDYKLVSILYDHYRALKEKKLLSFPDFLKLQNEMIAHFDLIAPYYLFGASDQAEDAEATESKKHGYRERAKKILANGYLFGPDWMRLHREFYDAFYAPTRDMSSEDFPIKPEVTPRAKDSTEKNFPEKDSTEKDSPRKEERAFREKSCRTCKFGRQGECFSKEICKEYEDAYSVSEDERAAWPDHGDATDIRMRLEQRQQKEERYDRY